MHLSASSFALVLLLTAVAQPAHADPAAQARFFDEVAREHYSARRYREALSAFFEEQRLAPNPRTVFNIALCFERLDDPARAFAFYEEYLTAGEAAPERTSYADKAKAKLAGRVARVRVESTPAGAEIYIDERQYGSYGRTPRDVVVSPGAHEVFLELAGHRAVAQKVTVGRGKAAAVSATLDTLEGKLSVTSQPEAEVQVRDEAGRTLFTSKSPATFKLPAGVYRVAASAPEHATVETLIRVRADENTTQAYTLPAAERAMSEVVFTSNVTGAVVEVDGEPIGFSPVVGELTAGPHNLKIMHPDRQPYASHIEVREGQRAWLTAQLEPPAYTERSSLTWLSGGLGIAVLGAGGLVGVLANQRHSDFEAAEAAGAAQALELRSDGRTLNVTADALMITGAIGVVTSVVLYFVTEREVSKPSSGSVSWEAQ